MRDLILMCSLNILWNGNEDADMNGICKVSQLIAQNRYFDKKMDQCSREGKAPPSSSVWSSTHCQDHHNLYDPDPA